MHRYYPLVSPISVSPSGGDAAPRWPGGGLWAARERPAARMRPKRSGARAPEGARAARETVLSRAAFSRAAVSRAAFSRVAFSRAKPSFRVLLFRAVFFSCAKPSFRALLFRAPLFRALLLARAKKAVRRLSSPRLSLLVTAV